MGISFFHAVYRRLLPIANARKSFLQFRTEINKEKMRVKQLRLKWPPRGANSSSAPKSGQVEEPASHRSASLRRHFSEMVTIRDEGTRSCTRTNVWRARLSFSCEARRPNAWQSSPRRRRTNLLLWAQKIFALVKHALIWRKQKDGCALFEQASERRTIAKHINASGIPRRNNEQGFRRIYLLPQRISEDFVNIPPKGFYVANRRMDFEEPVTNLLRRMLRKGFEDAVVIWTYSSKYPSAALWRRLRNPLADSCIFSHDHGPWLIEILENPSWFR